MLALALYSCTGPVAIRYPRGGEGRYRDCRSEAESILLEGGDVTIVSYGVMINEAIEAAERLKAEGISAELIKLGRIRPNSFSAVQASVQKTRRLVVVEDVCDFGCVGGQILASLAGGTGEISVRLLNLGDGIVTHGSVDELRRVCGIDAEAVVKNAKELCGKD